MGEVHAEQAHGLAVVRHGSPQDPPLLLVHGSGAAGASWNLMIPTLARRHQVVVVDLPGCGQSPPARTYDVPGGANRLAALLDDLGLRRVAVAGHSSGGYVGTALAEQRPDLVRSLALIGTGPSLDASRRQPLVLRLLLGPPFGGLIWSIRSDAWIRSGVTATAARPVDVPDEMVAGIRRIRYRTMRKVLRANTAYLAERSVPERLAALDVPVLVISGAADPRWDPASVRQYDGMPQVRVEMLPDVGHVPLLEAPEATSRLLLAFTASATGTSQIGSET